MCKASAHVAVFIVVLVGLACGGSQAQPASTTLTVALDSEWQVPSGFGVIIPLSDDRFWELLEHDRRDPPDIPEFSMWGEVLSGGELVQVSIAPFSDGLSHEARPAELLKSWFGSFENADFTEPVRRDRDGLHIATARGNARHPLESPPQGVDLTVFFEPDTQRVWRLFCLVSTGMVDNEVARICEQARDGFRPLEDPYPRG